MPEGPHSVTVTPGDGQITVAWERGTGSQANPVTASNSHDDVLVRDMNQLVPRPLAPLDGSGEALDDGWTGETVQDDARSLSGRSRSTGADGFARGTVAIDTSSGGTYTLAGWFRADAGTVAHFGLLEAPGDDATTWTRFFYPGDADLSQGLTWNIVAPDSSVVTWEELLAGPTPVDGADLRLQLATRVKGGVDDGLEADLLSRAAGTTAFRQPPPGRVWRLLLDNAAWLLLRIVRNSSLPVVQERAHEANRFFEAHCALLGVSAATGTLSGRSLGIQTGVFLDAAGTGAWAYHSLDQVSPAPDECNPAVVGLANKLPDTVFWDGAVVARAGDGASAGTAQRVTSPHVVTGLANNEAYRITVRTRTDSGVIFDTVSPQLVIPRAVPPAARRLRTGVARSAVRVVWDDDDESPPTYRVEWRMKGTTDWTTAVAGYRGTSYNLGGFDDGAEIEVRVVAGNSAAEVASEPVSRTVGRTVNDIRIPGLGGG